MTQPDVSCFLLLRNCQPVPFAGFGFRFWCGKKLLRWWTAAGNSAAFKNGSDAYRNDCAAYGNGYAVCKNGTAAFRNGCAAFRNGCAASGYDSAAQKNGYAAYKNDCVAGGNHSAAFRNGYAAPLDNIPDHRNKNNRRTPLFS